MNVCIELSINNEIEQSETTWRRWRVPIQKDSMAPFLTFLTHGYSSVVALSYSWDFLIYTTIAFSEIFFLPVCAAKRSKRALIGFLAITRVIIKKQLNLARLNQLLTVKKDVHL